MGYPSFYESQMGKEPEFWEYGCYSSPPTFIHSWLTPHTHTHPLKKGHQQLATQTLNFRALRRELPRESLPPETQKLFQLTAHSSPRWITLELRISSTTSRFSAFQRRQLPTCVLKRKNRKTWTPFPGCGVESFQQFKCQSENN